MKTLDHIHLRTPLKHLALACAAALGLGAGITHAAVTDISGTNVAVDTVVGAGNTGRLIGDTTTNTSAITKDLDLNGHTLTLNGNSNGAISGSGTVIVKGNIAGSTGNTYTGTTTVSASVALGKTAGNALCGNISVAAGTTLLWGANDQIEDNANVTLSSTSKLMLYAADHTTSPVFSDTIGELHVTTGAKVYTGLNVSGGVSTGWGGKLIVTELYIDGNIQPHTTVVENADGTSLVRGNGWIEVGGSGPPANFPGTPPTTFKLDGTPLGNFYIARQVSPPTAGLLIADISNSQYSNNAYSGGGFGAALQLNGHAVTLNKGSNNNGAISGSGGVYLAMGGQVGGSTGNTYTGTTTVSGAWVLAKTVGNALCGNITLAASATLLWGANDQIADDANVTVPATSALMLYGNQSFPSENFTYSGTVHVFSESIGELHVTTGAKVWTGAKSAGWGGVLSVTELYIDGVQQPHTSVVENATGSGLVRGNGWIQVGGSAAPAGYPATPPTTFKLDGTPTNDFYIARQVPPPMQAVLIADISNSQYSSNSYSGGGFGAALQLNGHAVTLNKGNNNDGAISGNGGVYLAMGGQVGGSTGNTYTGTTTVSGAWTLAKTVGNALCGDITVGASSSLTWSYANQISDLSNMTLTTGTSSLNLNGKADSFAGLTLATGATVTTGGAGGVLTVSSLTVGGVVQSAGTYTSVSNPEFVTGAGSVQVGLPAGSAYEIWASTHAGGQSASEDYDHDGVSNGLKYYMGAAGTLAGISPPVVTTAGVRTVTWPRDPSATVTSWLVQVSNDLAIWGDVIPPNASINTTDPTKVVYTLPTGTKQFCRLVVTP